MTAPSPSGHVCVPHEPYDDGHAYCLVDGVMLR